MAAMAIYGHSSLFLSHSQGKNTEDHPFFGKSEQWTQNTDLMLVLDGWYWISFFLGQTIWLGTLAQSWGHWIASISWHDDGIGRLLAGVPCWEATKSTNWKLRPSKQCESPICQAFPSDVSSNSTQNLLNSQSLVWSGLKSATSPQQRRRKMKRLDTRYTWREREMIRNSALASLQQFFTKYARKQMNDGIFQNHGFGALMKRRDENLCK